MIDFNRNLQINPLTSAIRSIKRVITAVFKDSKGIAGLKYLNDDQVPKYDKVYESTTGTFNPHYASSYLHDDTDSSQDENSSQSEN